MRKKENGLRADVTAEQRLMHELDQKRHEAEMIYISLTRARADALEVWARAVEAVILARKAAEPDP